MSASTSPFSLSQSFVAFRGFRRNRIVDHAPAQRPHGLVGHGGAPVLSEGCEPSYQDRTPGHGARPYRASGLVPWPNSDARGAGRAGLASLAYTAIFSLGA